MRIDMEQIKLFDYAETEVSPLRLYSKYQKWKWEHKYKKADKNSKKNCDTCNHCYCSSIQGGRKHYYKCELLGFSNSSATDIRLSYVCDLFERVK
jgi:hydrogenase maturation factor